MKRTLLTTSLVCLTLFVGVLGQSSAGLPKRQLVITGGQFTTDKYIDVGAFTAPVFPLDDREWVGTPQMSMLCYSPRVPKETFSLFTHMEDVVYPIIWYYPLDHQLGEWKYEYGDEIICQLWECDGASDGCDPARPSILPNPKAGDDLLGQATLSMGSYQILSSHLLNMTVPSNGKGKAGDQAASFLIECKGCKTLWSRDPSWVNPFTLPPPEKVDEKSPDLPPVSVPTAETSDTTQSPLPWRQGEKDPGTPESDADKGPDAAASPPPAKEENPVKPFEGPVVPTDPTGQEKQDDTSGDGSGGGSNVLVIVLAVLGALIGLLVISVLVYYGLKKWGWRRVDPVEEVDANPKDMKDENVARHLRIRVQRPADADAAIRQHQVDGAMAELPWQPHTKH